MGTLSSLRGKAWFYPEKQAAIFGRKGAFSQKNPKNAAFPLALCLKICYTVRYECCCNGSVSLIYINDKGT